MISKSSFMIVLLTGTRRLDGGVADLITSFGYNVRFAYDLDGLRELCKQEQLDLIVTDISIRDMALQGFLELLDGYDPNIGVIVVGEAENYLESLSGGALDYLLLPIQEEELEVKLARAIRERSLQRRLAEYGGVDEFSGFGDGQAFQKVYRAEVERTLRQNSSMHIVMVHTAVGGDRELRAVVNILQASIRRGVDQAFRVGENKFVLSLPETNADQATEILQRILLKALEQGLGVGALAIGCALCSRIEGKTAEEVAQICLDKVEGAVAESEQDATQFAVYRR